MLKKTLLVICVLFTASLVGCCYFNHRLSQKCYVPTQREQVCGRLKHDITFSNNNNGYMTGMTTKTPNQEAISVQQYSDYNCSELEK